MAEGVGGSFQIGDIVPSERQANRRIPTPDRSFELGILRLRREPRVATFPLRSKGQTEKGRRNYTVTGCLLPTGTGVSQLKRSAFSPRMIA